MANRVVMPRLGWTMETGTVVDWLKQDGERVTAGELLFSVESDKAISEVEALDSGVLYIPADCPIGMEIPVGATIGFILDPGEFPAGSVLTEPATAVASQAHQPATLADSSRQVVSNVASSISPRARRVAHELGVDWSLISGTGGNGRIRERDVRAFAATPVSSRAPRATPMVKRLAADSGVDLANIVASGPGGRIRRSDIAGSARTMQPGLSSHREVLPPIRRVVSQRMLESAQTVASVTLTSDADATDLVHIREQLKRQAMATGGLPPSYNDFLIRLVALALQDHPVLNASLDGDTILYHGSSNIGLAVDSPRGLVVPVVHHAELKSLREITTEMAELISQVRQESIGGDSLRGGTFTITNLGPYDVDAFTPIINLPECAILGVGRIVSRPVVLNESTDRVVVRKMVALSLTFDHRVVDGAPAARFLQQVRQMIQCPVTWLLEW